MILAELTFRHAVARRPLFLALVLVPLSATSARPAYSQVPSAADEALAAVDGASEQPDNSQFVGTSADMGRTNLRGVIEDSIRLLMIQHGVRVSTQEKTRRELGGPFLSDYRRSVRMPSQWGDGDSGLTNYLLHPGQGAVSGFIWLNNSGRGEIPFAWTDAYLTSRLWATVFAAVYSVQFEIGALSEASIGNVGLRPETAGWVDYVATPLGGLGIMMAEDLLDRFVIEKLEDRTKSAVLRALMRMWVNPSRATAHVSGMRSPWHRDGRPLRN